ncbi:MULTISPECIES: phosphate acyltransferase PlsX [unclassified Lentimonas]|uniref:phosphate acyltransferase PlsX n=1 Tax=unclassified Lentimonas TaxID=2630993 RepID=UPI00132A1A47|nr:MULTISPECIES: phosphate acyltransferase PlsX [unclassified Lentimonas]CAA6695392.1 Phosphate:acyl-ACP acyltransferase PlsX [Lentimonas sp. CC10]CAA6695800.1 Phosphate:acyl-ACP acyltransferase PlsX [Lentimonas sp. CC19]CAA7072038.1 Phosphate:acyl-ACP acyltransferase PlsX [Lentimonas sp. CC11]
MGASAVNCTIAVDTMGGDKGPTEFIRGLFYAIEELKLDCNFTLVGNQRLLERLLKVRKLDVYSDRIKITHSTQVIGMDEKPIQALKTKKDSSMVKAIALLKNQEADAMISCGNTGALMAGGTLRLRQIPGVDRPALGIIVPSKRNPFVLTDVGANPESTPENLVHNAILGSNYAKAALNISNPRVALLTIGTEEGKGNTLTNTTHPLLQNIDGVINYVGPIEGFQLFDGDVDVVVCDGFVGNIVLKSSEALFGFIGNTMREELVRNVKRKIGAVLSKSAFKDMKTRLGPDQHAGAPLLGLRGNILKSHGSSNFIAIANALRIAKEVVTHDMIDSIGSEINQANGLITNSEAENAP